MEKVMMNEEPEKKKEEAWGRGMWEMVKEGVFQRLLTWHLPAPPFLTAGKLSGLTVVVTGCTSGIGLYAAREMAMAGAQLVMACRNVEAANQIACSWKNEARDSNNMLIKIEVMPLNLLSLSSVRKFAEKWGERNSPLNALINNAGAFYMNEPQRFSEDGIDQHMQVNHVAPALLTLLLLPYLLKAPSPRIINVNSVSHHCALVNPSSWKSKVDEDSYHDMRSYGESKLAQLMFLKTLAAKLSQKGITSIPCVAVNPGIVKTNIVKYPMEKWKSFWMLNPAEGARSVLFCLTSEKLEDNLKKGFAYYTWLCTPAKEAPQAMDAVSCHNVWQKTMEILSFDEDYVSQITKC